LEKYEEELMDRLGTITNGSFDYNRAKIDPKRIVFAEADHLMF
jgi:malate dehydrogenase (oxaloacetate-decarboxylating)(NADP+)